MSKTGDRLRTLAGYWQPMGLDHTLMEIAKMADKEVEEAARKPALAADGEPLEVGQTVWVASNGDGPYIVDRIRPSDGALDTHYADNENEHLHIRPDLVTHQRPVLDADGVPIKVGDTVWPKYPDSDPRNAVESAEVVYVHRSGRVDVQATYATGLSFNQQVDAKQLTHTKPEPPDSWKQVEEDARKYTCEYFGHEWKTCEGCPAYNVSGGCAPVMASDIVRRCRALAERGK